MTKQTKAQIAAEELANEEATNKIAEVIGTENENAVVVKGKGAVRIGDVYAIPGTVVYLDEKDLKSQAWKYLFVAGIVEFQDDSARTKSFIDGIKRKARPGIDVGETDGKDGAKAD
ncbi:hypothetical protein [Erwinia phage Snitter]|nr:hypothetical protein [Erwinia phage Snitter]